MEIAAIQSRCRDFFARPNVRNILIILAFGLVFASPSIGHGVPVGDDIGFHFARYLGTWRAFQSGQIIPQLDPGVHGGFGYAINLFYPPLSAYLAVLMNIVTPNFTIAINAANLITQLAAGLAMYAFIRHVAANDTAGIISALAYMSAPYMISNFTVRAAYGEALGMVFAPVLFLGLWKIVHRESGWFTLGAGAAGLLLSHNLSAAIYAIFALLFMLCYAKDVFTWPAVRQFLLAATVAFGLAAFFLLPLLEARGAAEYNVFLPGFMTSEGLVTHTLLGYFSPLIIPDGLLPFAWIGLLGIIALVFYPLAWRVLPRRQQKFMAIALAFIIVAVIMTTRYFPWASLPSQFWVIQFPYRLNTVISFFLAALAGLITTAVAASRNHGTTFPNRSFLIASVGAIAIISAGLAMGPLVSSPRGRTNAYDIGNHWLHVMDIQHADYFPTRTINYLDDGNSAWVPETPDGFPQTLTRSHDPITLTGDIGVTDFTQSGRHLSFTAQVNQSGIVELPVFFYPGYRAQVDGVNIPVFESENGFAAVELNQLGAHQLTASFAMSNATRVGVGTTLVTLLSLAAYLIWRRKTASVNPTLLAAEPGQVPVESSDVPVTSLATATSGTFGEPQL